MGNKSSKTPSHKGSKSTKMVPSLDLMENDFERTGMPSQIDTNKNETRLATNDIINYLESSDGQSKLYEDMNTSSMVLELWWNKEIDKKFIRVASKYTFPEIHKLQVKLLGHLDEQEDQQSFENMLKTSFNQPMKYLHLGGGHYCNLSNYKKAFKNLLPLVTEEIYLVSFKIDGFTLSSIFKYAVNCKSLVICDCKIDFSTPFSMSAETEYQMTTLDLFGTCDKKHRDKINLDKASQFFGEIAKSRLPETLRSLHVHEAEFPSSDLNFIFENIGFKVKVKGDEKYPENIDG